MTTFRAPMRHGSPNLEILLIQESPAIMPGMEIKGRVQHGVVLPEEGNVLPEGAVVSIVYDAEQPPGDAPSRQRVTLPLVRSDRPGALRLTGDAIAEALDDEVM